MAKEKLRKYRSIPVTVDGIRFPSKREAKRYFELLLLQQQGKITELVVHRRWPIVVGGIKVCVYESDFEYKDNGLLVVEDAKGVRTRVYKLKKKLMLACHRIQIREV